MAEDTAGDKTEEATPQRRRESREKGRVARSTDLNNAVVFTATIMLLGYVGRDVLAGPMVLRGQALAWQPVGKPRTVLAKKRRPSSWM